MIKAPFNFVPLNEEPYIVDWADKISQDIPFEDGISGFLELQIQAETPVFISDTVHEDNTTIHEFCNVVDAHGEKHYFIPGTSIKGMLKNVIEILSFGKMTQVQNQSFGIRDLSNGTDGLFYRSKVKVDNVHCGWLKSKNNGYVIDDCGLPWRISAEELDRQYRMGLMNFIQDGQNFRSDSNKTAIKKYRMFHDAHNDDQLTSYFIPDKEIGISAGGRKFVRFGQAGEAGTIVFTGQPGVRKQKYNEKKRKMIWSGKFFEFVFPEKVENTNVPVPEQVFKAFESIHQNSSDYVGFRRKQLRSGESIPIFFIYDDEGNIDTMGVSYMYKFPAFNSVYNGIPIALLKQDRHDLCECIFGYTGKLESLKGRVQFTSAELQGNATFAHDVRLALAKPHPSYYPLYLGKGQTWNVESVEIAGRKRYPVRCENDIVGNEGTDNMSRIIRPLGSGSIFKGFIRFHNLRPIELGALISAIDFCQHRDCQHSIGQGKPLGYGKVKLSVVGQNLKCNSAEKSYSLPQVRAAFVNEMENHFNGWATSTQLTELFAMAKGIPSDKVSQFSYMTMSTTSENNDFKNGLTAYAQGEQLGTFTQILSGNVVSIGQLSNVSANARREDIELLLANEQARLEIEQARQKERREQELARQKEEEIRMQQRSVAEGIAIQAKEAFENKNYAESKELYEKAAFYGFDSYQAKIDECQMEIDKATMLSTGIVEYLTSVKLASIPAFANNLKKRNGNIPISDNDVPYIIQKIKDSWDSLKLSERKAWIDRKKWSPIEKEIGVGMTDAIYNGVKDLKIK